MRELCCNSSSLITCWKGLCKKPQRSIEKKKLIWCYQIPGISEQVQKGWITLGFTLARAAIVLHCQVHCESPPWTAFLPWRHNLPFPRKFQGSCEMLQTSDTSGGNLQYAFGTRCLIVWFGVRKVRPSGAFLSLTFFHKSIILFPRKIWEFATGQPSKPVTMQTGTAVPQSSTCPVCTVQCWLKTNL